LVGSIKIDIGSFEDGEEDSVVRLWNECNLVVSSNDPYRDIQRKRKVQPEMLLVARSEDRIVATVMAGYEGRRGWINYLAVDGDR